MEFFHDKSDLSGNQSSDILVERAGHLKQFVEGKAFDELEQHVQVGLVLEGFDDVVDAAGLVFGEMEQGLFFVFDVLDALAVDE